MSRPMAKTAAERQRESRARKRAAKGLPAVGKWTVECPWCGRPAQGRVGQMWCCKRCRHAAWKAGLRRGGADPAAVKARMAELGTLELHNELGRQVNAELLERKALREDGHEDVEWQMVKRGKGAEWGLEVLARRERLVAQASKGLDSLETPQQWWERVRAASPLMRDSSRLAEDTASP